MAKSKSLCTHCDAKITAADPFCPKCAQPTMYISAKQRTAWELEQWAKKRATRTTKVERHIGMAVEKVSPAGHTRRESASASISMKEPTRVRQKPTVHPAIAARAARRAAAASEHAGDNGAAPTGEKRVIVLPDVHTPPADVSPARESAPIKKPAETKDPGGRKKQAVERKEALPTKSREKSEPVAKKTPQQKEAAPKLATAAAAKHKAKTAPARSPKRPLVPVSVPAVAANAMETNGHGSNGHQANGHGANGTRPIANGNGHGLNGSRALEDVISEQNEILRQLLGRVAAIEEKMPVIAPRARRLRWFKR